MFRCAVFFQTIMAANHSQLKKGVFSRDSGFSEWLTQIKMNTVEHPTITIKLLDKARTVMIWNLVNAWPIQFSDLTTSDNGVAIDTIVFNHDGVRVIQ